MILDRLILKNFKRFRDADIQFRDGITGILGNNGTGKSSLVTAIFFALYGVRATGIAGDYIVSSFAGPKEKCEVALDFRIGGDTFRIIRTFKKGKSVTHDAEFYKNKKLLAKEVGPVEEAVRLTLGMGPVDFKNTIYAAQKDLLTLLENTPGKRKEWFQKALGIDYLKTGSDAALKAEIDKLSGELQRKEGEIAALAGRQSEEELARLQASVAAVTAAIAGHEQQKAALLAQQNELDLRLKVLTGKELAYNRLREQQQAADRELAAEMAQKARLEAALARVAGEEAECRSIEKTANAYSDLRATLDAMGKQKARHDGLTQQLAFIAREVDDLAKRAEKVRAQIASIDKDAAAKESVCAGIRKCIGAGPEIANDRLETAVSYRLSEMNKQIGTLAARQEQYRQEREKLLRDKETIRAAGPDGTCPLCRQKLGEHYQSLDAEFDARLQEIEEKALADLEKQERLAAGKAEIDALVPLLGTLRTIAERLKQRAGYEGDLAEIRTKQEKKGEEQQQVTQELAALAFDPSAYTACEQETEKARRVQARYAELQKKIGEAGTTRQQLTELTGRIATRIAELGNLKDAIAAAAYNPDEMAKATAARAENGTAQKNVEVAIANAMRDRVFAEEKIAEYRRGQEQIEALKNEAAAIRDNLELTRLTRSLIAEYVVYLMQVVRSRLEGEVSRIISEITGGRYEQVLLDADFNLLVRDIDNDYPVDRFSGGEQDDIAVALRIALSRYLAELHHVHESTFLIFDEIFGSQDEERRNNLLVALRTQESRFPQILLISHIAEMQGEFAGTLVIEPDTGSASRVREA